MKIAIMTQPLGGNYGGMMQAYALQQVLKRMGHEVVTIDRQLNEGRFLWRMARYAKRSLSRVTGRRKAPVFIEAHYPQIFLNTYAFMDQHISLSTRIASEAELKRHFGSNRYDAVIVGSDQTWRPRYSPNIFNYYLDFLQGDEIKRVAYASSFGTDRWEYTEQETDRCARLAQRFDSISVREASGVALCKRHLGVDASAVLDPTLLLDKHHYGGLIKDHHYHITEGAIFAYWLDPSVTKVQATALVSARDNKEVISCKARLELNNVSSSRLEDYMMLPVEQWLSSFASCSLVLTDSFHGVVFSIIFEKPFVAVINKERGGSRFESLLKSLNLEKNLVYDAAEIARLDINGLAPGPDAQVHLANLKTASMQFLSEALREEASA